jgi:hypothetical protein
MDLAYALQAVVVFLSLILCVMFLLWAEIRWHARQREELTHLLIFSLFRLSKKQRAAMKEQLPAREGLRVEAGGAEQKVRIAEEEQGDEEESAEATRRASRS